MLKTHILSTCKQYDIDFKGESGFKTYHISCIWNIESGFFIENFSCWSWMQDQSMDTFLSWWLSHKVQQSFPISVFSIFRVRIIILDNGMFPGLCINFRRQILNHKAGTTHDVAFYSADTSYKLFFLHGFQKKLCCHFDYWGEFSIAF